MCKAKIMAYERSFQYWKNKIWQISDNYIKWSVLFNMQATHLIRSCHLLHSDWSSSPWLASPLHVALQILGAIEMLWVAHHGLSKLQRSASKLCDLIHVTSQLFSAKQCQLLFLSCPASSLKSFKANYSVMQNLNWLTMREHAIAGESYKVGPFNSRLVS